MRVAALLLLLVGFALINVGGLFLLALLPHIGSNPDSSVTVDLLILVVATLIFVSGLWLNVIACKSLGWSLYKVSWAYLCLAALSFLVCSLMDSYRLAAGFFLVTFLAANLLALLRKTMSIGVTPVDQPVSNELESGTTSERKGSQVIALPSVLLFMLFCGIALGGSCAAFKDESRRFYAFLVMLCFGLVVTRLLPEDTLVKIMPTIKFGKD